ncbi:MAG: long-chain fatty acid--CoA ligase [Rhodobacteraceae bacterium]|nr:MAG: long-chain fatty acid--CoA ligase [Paracoccaceae bacterium]
MGAMTLDQAVDHLTTTNPTFAVCDTKIRGVTYRAFANVPPNLRALMQASREAQGNGAAEYLVFQDERWTYDEFCHETKQMAQALKQELGVQAGDRVAIAMGNLPELPIMMMAIASIGGVVVFLNAWWTSEELDYALTDTGAQVVFADGKRMERLVTLAKIEQIQMVGVRDASEISDLTYTALRDGVTDPPWPDVDIDPDQDFAVMYSSGTTSDPKGVVLTHRGAINAVFTWAMQPAIIALMDPPDPDAAPAPRPSALVATPLFHVTATHPLLLLSFPAGAKLTLLYRWDVEEAVRVIEAEKITRFLGVPTQSADLIAAAARMGVALDTLDYVGSGGAKRPPIQVSELARQFPKAQIATGWGMTETNANGIGMIGAEYLERPEAAGRLYPPVQDLRFLDDDGREVAPGEVGEITVKSPCNMRCYLNKPDETAEVFQDGWLRTGDLGRIDKDGYITIVDRKKNIIIRGGENISCLDVEAALHRHPAVAEACVFSLPDDRLGEVVGAVVQLRPGALATQAELITFLEQHIARFKLPAQIWIQTDPLPRAATDKIDRRGIRAACLTTRDIN